MQAHSAESYEQEEHYDSHTQFIAHDSVALGRLPQHRDTSPLGLRPLALKCVNTLRGHHSGVRVIAVGSNVHGEVVVYTGSYDNTIKVWHLDGGACLATLEGHAAWIRSLLVTHDETHLFSGDDDGIIKVWRTDTYALQRELLPDDDGRAGGILAITMDATRNLLLAGSYDASIYVWSLPHFELLHVLRGHRSAVRSLIVHGDFILSGSYDRSVKLWDLNQECSCAGSLGTRGSVWAMVVLEGLLVGAVGDSSIKVWRMDTWDLITTLSGHRGLVLALAVYKDRLISGSDDRCIRVWRAGSWECERVLTGHDGGVVGICFVQGNLISASNDSFIKIWNSSGNPRPFTAK